MVDVILELAVGVIGVFLWWPGPTKVLTLLCQVLESRNPTAALGLLFLKWFLRLGGPICLLGGLMQAYFLLRARGVQFLLILVAAVVLVLVFAARRYLSP